MKTKKHTCLRYSYGNTPAFIKRNRALCCRIAASLNDTAVDVRAGISTEAELFAAHNLVMGIGVPIKENWYGDGPGEVEFDCDRTMLNNGRKPRGGKSK